MELPKIGDHCSDSFCRQLDFLPIKCDACEKQFCKNHIRYEDHKCESSYKKDVQVPVCPLCNKPVPVPRGEVADIKVGEHIDRDCQSDPAKKHRQAYSNRCSAPKCKQKELIPVVCPDCRQNFCLRHRHTQDHDCKGFQSSGRGISNSGVAAIFRFNKASSSRNTVSQPRQTRPQKTTLNDLGRSLNAERQNRGISTSQLQGNLSEDEALARALQMSLADEPKPLTQEEKDRIMAQELQREEEERRAASRRRTQQESRRDDSNCKLS
ncbi:AN1-type zinc finger protein 2A-like [Styela clava]